jgi:hypothetical protein
LLTRESMAPRCHFHSLVCCGAPGRGWPAVCGCAHRLPRSRALRSASSRK